MLAKALCSRITYYLVRNLPYTVGTKACTDWGRTALDLSEIFLDTVLELLVLSEWLLGDAVLAHVVPNVTHEGFELADE